MGRFPGFQLGKIQLFWGNIFSAMLIFLKKLSKQRPPALPHPYLPLLSMCETPRYDMIVIYDRYDSDHFQDCLLLPVSA